MGEREVKKGRFYRINVITAQHSRHKDTLENTLGFIGQRNGEG